MVAYLDSSVLLQHVIRADERISQVFGHEVVVSSELLEIECMRVVHRYRMDGTLDDEGFLQAKSRIARVLDSVSIIAMSTSVKRRAAEAFPVTVKTLDALHLSSALAYVDARPGETLAVFSYDRGLNRCASALGFSTPFAT